MKQRWKTVFKSLKTLMKPLEITVDEEKEAEMSQSMVSAQESMDDDSSQGLTTLEKRALNDPKYVVLRKACV